MSSTEFHSVHGLPPDAGEKPDISTPRDLARLSLEIVKHPRALTYTSTIEKWFRNNTFEMLTHNRLLRDVPGCDGLKTGFISAGGFSIAASAKRNDRRVIAVVTGCKSRRTRDDKARELLAYGFMNLPKLKMPEPPPDPPDALPPDLAPDLEPEAAARKPSILSAAGKFCVSAGKLVVVLLGLFLVVRVIGVFGSAYRRKRDSWKYKL
jgi:D-alanyl-D-alanine carboxypeptidase (penicillin-binding protein 5/6)